MYCNFSRILKKLGLLHQLLFISFTINGIYILIN